MREALLEPFLRSLRIRRILPYVLRHPRCELLDVGCGVDASLLRSIAPYVARGVGIDPRARAFETANLKTLSVAVYDRLPFPDEHFDMVTMLAVLEHLQEPESIVSDIARVLRPGGALLLTAPTWAAKPLLEFLAFRLNLVSAQEVRDHKRYFSRRDLLALVGRVARLTVRDHRYFQGGFNSILYATRNGG
jgi:2-polyprenyl-3-methyl-5-hydroxy-6-metoxy-1,4-benzoquinol methylase